MLCSGEEVSSFDFVLVSCDMTTHLEQHGGSTAVDHAAMLSRQSGWIFMLVFAFAMWVDAQPWPAEITGCSDGFFRASPTEPCTRCAAVDSATKVTCTTTDDSRAVECQRAYLLTLDGRCIFDNYKKVIAYTLLSVFLVILCGGLCCVCCSERLESIRQNRVKQARVLASITVKGDTDVPVATAAHQFLAPVQKTRKTMSDAEDKDYLARWKGSSAP